MELVPDVLDTLPVFRLAASDIEKDHSRPLIGNERRLERECQSIPAVEVEAAGDGFQRARETVRLQLRIARIPLEQRESTLESGLAPSECSDLRIKLRRLDDLSAGLELVSGQSSGPNVGGTSTGLRSPRRSASRLSP